MDLTIKGAEELDVLAKRIKQHGDKNLRKELLRGIREGTKGTKAKIKANAMSELPGRGGLARRVAGSKFATKTRTTSKVTSIRITAANAYEVKKMNAGMLRHPVYGNRKKWVSQTIKAGWFTDPIEADAPAIRAALGKVMADIAAKIEGK
jgi:hypothetical protein